MMSICFILLLLISILTQSYGQVTCASGWVQYSGSCYLFRPVFNSGSTYGTWVQCNDYCTTASYPGATMLCVNNATENEWIRSQYESHGNIDYWIGYTDMLPYGGGKNTKQYGWVTGCSSTYTYWGPREPDNQGNNEDYAAVHPNNGIWFDWSPQNQVFCGCEYNPALTTSRPSTAPSSRPSTIPSFGPTVAPSSSPSVAPSSAPSVAPSSDPSADPSSGPTFSPTATPSFRPSVGAVSE